MLYRVDQPSSNVVVFRGAANVANAKAAGLIKVISAKDNTKVSNAGSDGDSAVSKVSEGSNGSGSDSGSGSSSGSENGISYGSGNGYGNDYGNVYENGYGNGNGYGIGYGNGYGNGRDNEYGNNGKGYSDSAYVPVPVYTTQSTTTTTTTTTAKPYKPTKPTISYPTTYSSKSSSASYPDNYGSNRHASSLYSGSYYANDQKYGYGGSYHDKYPAVEANYDWEYAVNDKHYVDFGHKESRHGYAATGKYYVALPDGRFQTVTYVADENGYKPVVDYNGDH